MYKQCTDEELVVLLQQGKDRAFDELYIRYRDVLVRFVHQRMKSLDIAQEIVQEVFTTIWERRRMLVIQKKFSSYVYASVRYVTLDYIKAHAVTDEYVQEVVEASSPKINSTEDYIFHEELQDALQRSTDLLPKKAKEVFILSRFKNYTNKEISEELNISTDTVKYHIAYALRFMRINLKEFYFLLLFWLV
ncbi:RNA polymerase sigma-70 factor [Flavobacterium sp.]|uniref:RNA polymerase sigma-70 factor n=1 Tax=Flavobacterium sp. TaxID=239 RepID=UPI003C689CDC